MSTEIGRVKDALDPDLELEVYWGTGGVALLLDTSKVKTPNPELCKKFWLNTAGLEQLLELLEIAGHRQ